MSAVLLAALLVSGGQFVSAQEAAVSTQEASEEEKDIVVLSPFTVEGSENVGYQAASTLAGTRFRTDLSDVASAISVLTEEFLTDLGATDNETVLAYVTNAEVGGPRGNYSGGVSGGSVARENNLFANPNGNTRVRGLSNADNTRNYFTTDIPWDGYTVKRVDLLRGPNSILFGLGSPAGVINATTESADFLKDHGSANVTFDKFGSIRASVDYNKVLIEKELAVYVAGLRDDVKFRQDPAYELDERYFAAVKYAPKALNSTSTRFEVSASYENGSIESNRPRTLTPADLFTTFWNPVTRRSAEDNTVYTAATYPGYPGGLDKQTANHFYDPEMRFDRNTAGNTFTGATINQFMNGPQFQFNTLSNVLVNTGNITTRFGAFASDGSIVGNGSLPQGVTAAIWGDNFRRQGMAPTSNWATDTKQYGAGGGFWENHAISDPSVFDFFNNLLDGPNKKEWQDWEVLEASISHTFFDGKVGYNLAVFNQQLDGGQYGILGWESRIGIDINEQVEWSAPQSGNPLVSDPVIPNPNLGRAYVQEVLHSTGNGINVSDRDAWRAQVFGSYDFEEKHENFLTRILGNHTVTGLYSDESRYSDSRRMNMALLSPEDYAAYGNNIGEVSFRYYLSDDLRGKNSAAGSNLSRINEYIIPSSGPFSVRMFDTTWKATDVNPTDPWEDPDNLREETFALQAANPDNYVGWADKPATLVTFIDGGMVGQLTARDYLTNNASLSDFNVKSKVFVWQGSFFNDSIIGLYGYRQDEASNVLYTAPSANLDPTLPGRVDVRPFTYNLNNAAARRFDLDVDTRNWSATVHLNRLLGDRDFLPFKVSLYYNEGENLQPAAGRLDAYGQPLPPPAGSTEEYSILLQTKDGKYSLRATDYKTVVTNQNTTGDIGAMFLLQQGLWAPAEAVARFDAGTWSVDGHPDTDRLVNVIIPAWKQFEADLQNRFPDFVDAWLSRGTWNPGQVGTRFQRPAGHRFTEDAISEGLEFEFTANPTPNWRLALNASKTEATRNNVPGNSFLEVAEFMDNAITNTPVGETPVFWNASPGVRTNIWPNFRGDYLKLKALNGQAQQEVREWRANLVTNYSFTEGRLAGFGLGGALRWEDSAAVDYLPSADNPNLPDISDPVLDDGTETFDLWVSYSRKLSDKVKWIVQLNVFNVFGENELVPLSTDPFGNPNRWRIREGMSWRISNTLQF